MNSAGDLIGGLFALGFLLFVGYIVVMFIRYMIEESKNDKTVKPKKEYSDEIKQKVINQYTSSNPTYNTSKQITRQIAERLGIQLNEVVDILKEPKILLSGMGDWNQSQKLYREFFSEDRIAKIFTTTGASSSETTEDGRRREALRTIHNQLISELQKNTPIPADAIHLECEKGLKHIEDDMTSKDMDYHRNYSVYAWKDGDDLCYTYLFELNNLKPMRNLYLNRKSYFGSFYESKGKIKNSFLDAFNGAIPVFRIKHDDLLFYAHEGDFYIKTDVKGSGGGTDYARAIVGGVLFGAAGAIVASRKGVNISTTTEEVDKRNTVLYFKYNGEIADAHFDSNTYKTFKRLLPGKDSSVIDKLSSSTPKSTAKQSTEEAAAATDNDITKRMKKLSSLLEDGYITKDEYEEKKKKILDEI